MRVRKPFVWFDHRLRTRKVGGLDESISYPTAFYRSKQRPNYPTFRDAFNGKVGIVKNSVADCSINPKKAVGIITVSETVLRAIEVHVVT